MEQYVIGMDGGGTKTAVSIADLAGHVLLELKGGAINCNSEAPVHVLENLGAILDGISAHFGGLDGCAGICLAAAGISNPTAAETIQAGVANRYRGPLSIVGDHEAALCGAVGKPYGIILISGTGTICFGRDLDGKEHRTGGFGHLIDDGGSGYAIGRDILSAVVRASDGRAEKTVLTELVFHELGISSIPGLIRYIYEKETGKREIAALAPLLDDACRRGDSAAEKIVKRSTDSLLELLFPVIGALHFEKPEIALCGSILLRDEFIRNCLFRGIASSFPDAKYYDRKFDASYGAVLIALENGKHRP